MSFAANGPVPSGQPFPIRTVNDHDPASLDDFVGASHFMVDALEPDRLVAGQGGRNGDGVRFHEKDDGGTGRDVRVWTVSTDPESGRFTAQACSDH